MLLYTLVIVILNISSIIFLCFPDHDADCFIYDIINVLSSFTLSLLGQILKHIGVFLAVLKCCHSPPFKIGSNGGGLKSD